MMDLKFLEQLYRNAFGVQYPRLQAQALYPPTKWNLTSYFLSSDETLKYKLAGRFHIQVKNSSANAVINSYIQLFSPRQNESNITVNFDDFAIGDKSVKNYVIYGAFDQFLLNDSNEDLDVRVFFCGIASASHV